MKKLNGELGVILNELKWIRREIKEVKTENSSSHNTLFKKTDGVEQLSSNNHAWIIAFKWIIGGICGVISYLVLNK